MPATGVFPAQVSPDLDAAIYAVELLGDAAGDAGQPNTTLDIAERPYPVL